MNDREICKSMMKNCHLSKTFLILSLLKLIFFLVFPFIDPKTIIYTVCNLQMIDGAMQNNRRSDGDHRIHVRTVNPNFIRFAPINVSLQYTMQCVFQCALIFFTFVDKINKNSQFVIVQLFANQMLAFFDNLFVICYDDRMIDNFADTLSLSA